MKVWIARLVDVARAGALAAGIATLVGLWFQGMKILGFRGAFPDGLGDFLMTATVGIILGATLGFPTRVERTILHVARVIGAAVSGSLFGVAIGAIAYLLVGALDVAERDLPPFFLAIGVVLVGVGIRRTPRTTSGRVTLGAALGVLVIMRCLALWPTAAHAVTRRLFPLPESTTRAEFDARACGELCEKGRTHVISFESKAAYHVDHNHLQGEAKVNATVEVDKPFFQDLCGYVYDQPPTIPESVRPYTTLQACHDAHPKRPHVFDISPHFEPSPCCRLEVKERHPGERMEINRTLPFVFHAMEWKGVD